MLGGRWCFCAFVDNFSSATVTSETNKTGPRLARQLSWRHYSNSTHYGAYLLATDAKPQMQTVNARRRMATQITKLHLHLFVPSIRLGVHKCKHFLTYLLFDLHTVDAPDRSHSAGQCLDRGYPLRRLVEAHQLAPACALFACL